MQITITGMRNEGKTTVAQQIAACLQVAGASIVYVGSSGRRKQPAAGDGPLSNSTIMIVDVDETETARPHMPPPDEK